MELKKLYRKIDRKLEELETDEYYMVEKPNHEEEKEHYEELAKLIEEEISKTLQLGEKFIPRRGKQFYLN